MITNKNIVKIVEDINYKILDTHEKTNSLYEFNKLLSKHEDLKDELYHNILKNLYKYFDEYQALLKNITFCIEDHHNAELILSLDDLNNCYIIFTSKSFKFNINETQYHINIELSSINEECYKNSSDFIINKANLVNNLPNAYKACQDLLINSYDKIISNFEKKLEIFLENYKNNIEKANNELNKKINLYTLLINETKKGIKPTEISIDTLCAIANLQNINKNIDMDEDIER